MSVSLIKQPFENFFGGKSVTGTYQPIINHIPPHRIRFILFLGNGGIHAQLRPAEFHVLNDLDNDVTKAWDATGIGLQGDTQLLNMDALTFLRYDINHLEYQKQRHHTFIYLDPPYLMETRKGQHDVYKHEMTTEQHEELLSLITAMRDHKIMISHPSCKLYDSMLSTWNKYDFQSKTRHGLQDERIYFNYELDGHLHDYSYIGKNFRIREKYKRITTNFFAKLDRLDPLLRNAMLQEYELQYRNKLR